MSKVQRYEVQVQRDESGWWVASATQVVGVHTQGRTIAQARERIREALSAATGENEATIQVEERLVLDPEIRGCIDEARSAREEAERLQRRAQDAARIAAREFSRRGLSTRDAGDLLQMSHQRVHQLLRSKPTPKKARWAAGTRPKGR